MTKPDEAPADTEPAESLPRCEALRLHESQDTRRCAMPGRVTVTYETQRRRLCTTHAKQYDSWGRDQAQMARALWKWPTRGELAALEAPALEGFDAREVGRVAGRAISRARRRAEGA